MTSQTKSVARRLGVAAGAAQTLGLLLIAVGSAMSAPRTRGWTADTSRIGVAISEVVIYVLFAAGCAWLTWGFATSRPRAWTPFVLIQAFAIICAWPLVRSDQAGYVVAGVLTAVAAGLGIGSALAVRRADGMPSASPHREN